MLPVVRGERATVRQILLYSVALVAVTRCSRSPGHVRARLPRRGARARPVFLWLACGCGARRPRAAPAILFHYSLAYLALLFVGGRRSTRSLCGRPTAGLARRNILPGLCPPRRLLLSLRGDRRHGLVYLAVD